MISALILTYNEEANLAACIESLPWRDDVTILDSGSADRTVAIAAELGAQVVTRAFTDYADQRNFALALPGRHAWIVMIDADERMTPDLAREIARRVEAAPAEAAMFQMRRRDIFMARWLKRSSGYPTWFPRVFRRGRVRVERAINETYAANGSVHQLEGHLDHYPFNKGLDWWFERHNRYSTMEAKVLGGEQRVPLAPGDLLASEPGKRRAALKRLAYRLPGRPLLIFLYLYVFRLGFLDGVPGFHFACMRMAYEIMIDAKAAQLRYLNQR